MPSVNRRILLVFLLTSLCIYQRFVWQTLPSTSRPIVSIPDRKISIAHYTNLYGIRTDSNSKIFNPNLASICQILDPDDYPLAHSVFVSLVDLKHLPPPIDGISYRRLHPSQLWIAHSEESPRNSYRKIDWNVVDSWFNLTATLKPESDFHIQYRGYRVKPEIGHLLQTKLNINLQRSNSMTSQIIFNESSNYFNNLSLIFNKELIDRQNLSTNLCPYTCNQPLSDDILSMLQPYLPPIEVPTLHRKIVYIAWFVSNCNTHSRREEYVAKLRTQPGIHVDIYGYCQSIYHRHLIPNQCNKGTPNCTEQILSHYRFYLSFENSLCDSYITEKYWIQGLNQHIIPIVLGAKREQYQRLAVPHSYLHVDDYPTVEDLAKELHRLNENTTELTRYLQWTQLYDVGRDYQPEAMMDMHSALCFLGHYRSLHAIKTQTRQIKSLMKLIKQIFHLSHMHLPNFNWTTARTKTLSLRQFYHPQTSCWDKNFPSPWEQIQNYFFTWWTFF